MNRVEAQQAKIDSLLGVVETMERDTNKVRTLVAIALAYTNLKPDQSVAYAEKAIELSKELNFDRGIIEGLNQVGLGYVRGGHLKTALIYLDQGIALAEEKGYPDKAIACVNLKGVIYGRTGNFDNATTCYYQALELARQLDDSVMITSTLGNIGTIFYKQGELEQALDYYQQALAVDRAIGYELGAAINLGNIGLIYHDDSLTEKALQYFDESLTISRKIDDTYGVAYTLCCISSAYLETGMIELAERYCEEALEVAQDMGSPEIHVTALHNVVHLQHEKSNYRLSNQYAQEALTLADKIDDESSKKKLYSFMVRNYAGLQDFERAYEMQKKLEEVNDKLFDDEKSKQVLELSIRYATEQKETENQYLREEQTKNETIIRNRNALITSIGIIVLLLSLLAFTLYRSKSKEEAYNKKLAQEVDSQTAKLQSSNKQLKRSTSEMERFAFIASHDLKEPLRNINSFTALIERRLPDADEEVREFLAYLKDNATQMHQLVERILEFSRLNNEGPVIETVNLNDLVEEVKQGLGIYLSERNGIMYIDPLPTIKTDATQVFIVLKNLIENGLKYNESEVPVISVQYVTDEKVHLLKVKDNGLGIKPEFQDDVFVMFKRLQGVGQQRGSGMGLSICKKIVESLGGEIWIEYSKNEVVTEISTGTTFVFSLPK